MRRRTKTNPIDMLIERTYYTNAQGVQINILDIPTVYRRGYAAWNETHDTANVERAVIAAIAELRKN